MYRARASCQFYLELNAIVIISWVFTVFIKSFSNDHTEE